MKPGRGVVMPNSDTQSEKTIEYRVESTNHGLLRDYRDTLSTQMDRRPGMTKSERHRIVVDQAMVSVLLSPRLIFQAKKRRTKTVHLTKDTVKRQVAKRLEDLPQASYFVPSVSDFDEYFDPAWDRIAALATANGRPNTNSS